jgi:hypothetical protein
VGSVKAGVEVRHQGLNCVWLGWQERGLESTARGSSAWEPRQRSDMWSLQGGLGQERHECVGRAATLVRR